jgi:hypothetical protein
MLIRNGLFYLYKKLAPDWVKIHLGDCSFCNGGHGKDESSISWPWPPAQNRRWTGPYETFAAAYTAARALSECVSTCHHCGPLVVESPDYGAQRRGEPPGWRATGVKGGYTYTPEKIAQLSETEVMALRPATFKEGLCKQGWADGKELAQLLQLHWSSSPQKAGGA